MPSRAPYHASQMYATNVVNLLKLMVTKTACLTIDRDDEIIRETLVTHEGKVVNPRESHNECPVQEVAKSMNYEFGLYVFMLAAFLGFELIRKVSPLLHTPLMSLTNAIASISVVGAILISGENDASTLSRVLGFIAVVSATTNLVSGYLITDRMLKMFKKREPAKK